MKKIGEIAEAIGASAVDIENWHRTLELRTNYQPTVQGRARVYSRENALELAFIAAFAKAGVRPGVGVAYAHAQVRMTKSSKYRQWIMFRVSDATTATQTDDITQEKIEAFALKGNPPAVAVIAAGEIVRRVNALFEEA